MENGRVNGKNELVEKLENDMIKKPEEEHEQCTINLERMKFDLEVLRKEIILGIMTIS